MLAFDQAMENKQRARTRDDRPPDLGGMSPAESRPRPENTSSSCHEERSSSVGGKVQRHSGVERGSDVERHSSFPLVGFLTAAKISLSLEAGRAQLGNLVGRPMKDVLGNHLKDLLFLFVHWLSITL